MKKNRTVAAKFFSQQGYEKIDPMEFYRAMFPAGELAEYSDAPRSPEANKEWRYNAVLLENTHKSKPVMKTDPRTKQKHWSEKEIWKNHIVLDDLSKIESAVQQYGQTDSEFYIAPISYLGRKRIKLNERWIYACIIEVDHPKVEIVDGHRRQSGLLQLIHDWTKSSIPYAMPTACVCSGTGLHLIYLLDRPYQIQDDYQKQQWDNFRQKFTHRIWNKYVTNSHIQYENHCQSFRVVGTRTKKGQLVEAFWLSKKRYTIDELFSQVRFDPKPKWSTFEECVAKMPQFEAGLYPPDELMKTVKEYMPKDDPDSKPLPKGLQEAKEKWGDWYQKRIVEKQPPKKPGQYLCHRGLYDWFFEAAKVNPYVGARYNRVHALAEYAVKCGITYDEFKKDAYELYEIFKVVDQKEPFKYLEFVKARDEYFNEMAHRSTRKWIEANTGVPMNPPAKRNGRKKDEHIDRVNQTRKFRRDVLGDDEYAKNGRPDKASIVKQWRTTNPTGKKADCARETGLDPKTIRKWWDV